MAQVDVSRFVAPEPDTFELSSARCIIRPALPGDASALFEAAQTPGFIDWLSWETPASATVIEARFVKQLEAWRRGVAFCLSVVDPASGEIIGGADLKADPFEPQPGRLNLGYWTHPKRQRRGYAGEYVGAIVDWALGSLGAEQLVAGVALDNEGSHRILRRLGFEAFEERSICSSAKRFANVRYRLNRSARFPLG